MEELDDIKRWAKGEYYHMGYDTQDIITALSKVIVAQQEQITELKEQVEALKAAMLCHVH